MKAAFITLLFAFSVIDVSSQNLTENSIVTPWLPISPFGITVGDPALRRWEAGRVNDILEIDNDMILAAADLAGVWMIRRGGSVAVSMSKTWISPDMNSLAKYTITNGNRTLYFAGGSDRFGSMAALYQTNPASRAPLLESWQAVPTPNINAINKILVLQQLNKILLATNSGIWWSDIPASGLPADYRFTQVRTINNFVRSYNDLAEGPNNTVIASIRGNNDGGTVRGIFYGTFSGNTLSFTNSTVNGLTPSESSMISTTSIASCNGNKTVVYAITASSSNEGVLYVSKSTDGGISFTKMPISLIGRPAPEFGGQGINRNNCIDVHPLNANIVSFGWVTGPYISDNGATTFKEVERTLTHDDKTCILFSAINNNRMYVGSDGGVASFNSLTSSNNYNIDYTWNMRLPTLQFVSPTAIRQWWGRTTSKSNTNVVGGGLQDNGVVINETGGPWKHIEPGFDGSSVFFPACGGMLWANAGSLLRYRAAGNSTTDGAIPITVFAPGADRSVDTLAGVFNTVDGSERRTNARGQKMYAISSNTADVINGTPTLNNIYGVFANFDGTDIHAEYLATLNAPQSFTSAISSNDPAEIFIGKRTTGLVYKLIWNSVTRTYDQIQGSGINADNNGFTAVGRVIDVPTSSEAFAIRNDASMRGDVYYTRNGADWTNISANLSGERIYGLELFRNGCKNILFVATDKAIYATTRPGVDSWTDISFGLPAVPHISDIHVVPGIGCSTSIYLATFGWSVFKATIK